MKKLLVVVDMQNDFIDGAYGLTFAEHDADTLNVMQPVFRDGKMLIDYSLSDVRNNLWDGKF